MRLLRVWGIPALALFFAVLCGLAAGYWIWGTDEAESAVCVWRRSQIEQMPVPIPEGRAGYYIDIIETYNDDCR
jgi:hypothetical protein